MPYSRVMQIWKFFKIANPEDPSASLQRGQAGYDPKFWVKPLYSSLQEALNRLFFAGGYIVMDEYMQGSAHRVAYRRVIKGKPKSHGLLWYVLCGMRRFCDASGNVIKGATVYIPLSFDLYTADEPWRRQPGPRGGKGVPLPEFRGYGEGGCFLRHFLTRMIANESIKKGTCIIGDRLFSTVKLLRLLQQLGFLYIGTAKKNCKGVPNFEPFGQAERGTFAYRVAKNLPGLALGWWRDSSDVLMMTLGCVVPPSLWFTFAVPVISPERLKSKTLTYNIRF